MTPAAEITKSLRSQSTLYREILTLVEREVQALKSSDGASCSEIVSLKRALHSELTASLTQLREHRIEWQRMGPAERSMHPEIGPLIRQNQDLIMRIIMLDRENEQILLRRGLVPAQHLPSVSRQRPHFVADLYRKNQGPVA